VTTPGRPSWAGPAAPAPVAASAEAARPPATLVAAVVGAVGLAVAEGVYVAGRDELRPAMRVFLLVVVALQLPLAVLTLRRSSAGAMLLLLCSVTALVASLAGGLGPGRAAAAVASAVVLVLLARSLPWFPDYKL
jgi:hypothetical protein